MANAVSTSRSEPASQRQNRLIGVALMCAALFCPSWLDATGDWVNQTVASYSQLILMRALG